MSLSVRCKKCADCTKEKIMTENERCERFEKMLSDVYSRQRTVSQQLSELKAQGKEKTCRFRELMGTKLSDSYVISLFQAYGLDELPAEQIKSSEEQK